MSPVAEPPVRFREEQRTRQGRPCPVEGCSNERDPAHVMCKRCWYMVPQPLRETVWRTYRLFGAWDDRSVLARENAIDAAEAKLAEALRAAS